MTEDTGGNPGVFDPDQLYGADDEIEIEDKIESEDAELVPFKYSISSYGADYPVDSLVQRFEKEDIFIPPFQRGFVWSLSTASRFVESLLLGLPVPGIFLSREEDTHKLLVIDGQQRLLTLKYFYEGVFKPSGREFALHGLPSQFNGQTYKSLAQEDRRRLDDSILHATIVRQDEPSEDESSIYHIFERLNTGGLRLLPQEIRTCIYHGRFTEFLRELNDTPSWRKIYGKKSNRMRDQELILRFLALRCAGDSYTRPMKEFLNIYMAENRNLDSAERARLGDVFRRTLDVVLAALGARAFRPVRALNAAVYDAVTVGVSARLARGEITDLGALSEEYEALLESADFAVVTNTSTTNEANVKQRLRLASEAFADVR